MCAEGETGGSKAVWFHLEGVRDSYLRLTQPHLIYSKPESYHSSITILEARGIFFDKKYLLARCRTPLRSRLHLQEHKREGAGVPKSTGVPSPVPLTNGSSDEKMVSELGKEAQ